MKPTPEQCRLAIAIGAALLQQGGKQATDLIRAAQAVSPALEARLGHLLDGIEQGALPEDVARWAREFYAESAPDPDRRDETLRIRLSAAEKTRLEQQAQGAGESVSAYVRRTCGIVGDRELLPVTPRDTHKED